MPNEYHKKYEEKLLIAILDKYIESQGNQPYALSAFQFFSLDKDLYKTIPQIKLELVADRQNTDGRYLKNLELKKHISKNKSQTPYHFFLTDQGFIEANRLKNPLKCFIKEHWKFLIGTSFAFIASVIGILRYIEHLQSVIPKP